MRLRDCHYAIGLLLSMGLIPALRALHLPVQFDWMHHGIAFWCQAGSAAFCPSCAPTSSTPLATLCLTRRLQHTLARLQLRS